MHRSALPKGQKSKPSEGEAIPCKKRPEHLCFRSARLSPHPARSPLSEKPDKHHSNSSHGTCAVIGANYVKKTRRKTNSAWSVDSVSSAATALLRMTPRYGSSPKRTGASPPYFCPKSIETAGENQP